MSHAAAPSHETADSSASPSNLSNIRLEAHEKACNDVERELEALATYGAIACLFNPSGRSILVLTIGRSHGIVGVEEKQKSVG